MTRSMVRKGRSALSVITLGVVMVLAGTYEVYFGNTYISVERGWSAFISGTVLVTGGLVTIALGLAIRAITDLSAVLRDRGGSADAEIAPAHSARDLLVATPAIQPASPRLDPSSGALAAALTPQLVPDLLRTEGRATGSEHATDVADAEPDHSSEPLKDEDPETHLDARSEPQTVEPAMDDWLDRSFADLSRDFLPADGHDSPVPGKPAEHAPLAAAGVEHEVQEHHEPTEPELEPHGVPDHEADAAALDSLASNGEAPPTAPTSPVIGRYDAEGTSYVMYADGSIEAQSEAGVYRFASMAELKAFIEG